MRLKVRQETSYHYDQPALSAIQILRLTPRNFDSQFVKSWRVEVDADYRLYRDEDPFGNITHTFSIEGPIESMRVVVEGEVETRDTNGIITGTAERMPLGLWLRESALTRSDAAIRMFARRIAASEGGAVLPFLHALNTAIHTRISYETGGTTTATTAAEAFTAKKGVCQDLAQIFVTACRSVRIPARYVGGYFLRTDIEQHKAGHAWAEAYVHGIGWIGFDPTHDICTTDRYLRIACGVDATDAAPIRGARVGGYDEHMEIQVQVTMGRMLIEE